MLITVGHRQFGMRCPAQVELFVCHIGPGRTCAPVAGEKVTMQSSHSKTKN